MPASSYRVWQKRAIGMPVAPFLTAQPCFFAWSKPQNLGSEVCRSIMAWYSSARLPPE